MPSDLSNQKCIIHCINCGQLLELYPHFTNVYFCDRCRVIYDVKDSTFRLRGLSSEESEVIRRFKSNANKIIAFLHRVAVFDKPEEDWQKYWNQMVFELEQSGQTRMRDE